MLGELCLAMSENRFQVIRDLLLVNETNKLRAGPIQSATVKQKPMSLTPLLTPSQSLNTTPMPRHSATENPYTLS